MVKVNWSKQAIEDLYQIREYLSLLSPRFAEALTDEVFNKEITLQNHPYIGRIVPEFSRKFIRELLYKQYRIIYHIVSDVQIDIVAIHHSSRSLSESSVFDDEE
jgi:toxin ParE1/3/4